MTPVELQGSLVNDIMTIESLAFIATIALGTIFSASGLSKLRDPDGFVLGVLEYEVLPPRLALAYGRILPFVELVSGLALVIGFLPTAVGLLAALLLASFLLAVVINLVRRRRIDCHCFGSRQSEPIGSITIIRLLILLAAALLVAGWQRSTFLSVALMDLIPTLSIAAGLVISLYLLGAIPGVWHAWRAPTVMGVTLNGGRVSLRDLPLRCAPKSPDGVSELTDRR